MNIEIHDCTPLVTSGFLPLAFPVTEDGADYWERADTDLKRWFANAPVAERLLPILGLTQDDIRWPYNPSGTQIISIECLKERTADNTLGQADGLDRIGRKAKDEGLLDWASYHETADELRRLWLMIQAGMQWKIGFRCESRAHGKRCAYIVVDSEGCRGGVLSDWPAGKSPLAPANEGG